MTSELIGCEHWHGYWHGLDQSRCLRVVYAPLQYETHSHVSSRPLSRPVLSHPPVSL